MKTTFLFFLLVTTQLVIAQTLEIKPSTFRTLDRSLNIRGETGYLIVPENRQVTGARKIRIKFVRLRSLSATPREPVIYLEGGGSACTWQAESPKDLTDWLPILRVADLIFVDQRGTNDEDLTYVWRGVYPEDFFLTEEAAGRHYQQLCKEALTHFSNKAIDVSGYNVAEHARDIDDLAKALHIENYSLFGFSFGSHIGMTAIKLFSDRIVNAVFVGADAPDQSFNYPVHLDDHVKKISTLMSLNASISEDIPDLNNLLINVMHKLANSPAVVKVKHPLTGKPMQIRIGPFGLSLILRLEIDDTSDIPAIPRLLHAIDHGDYSMLEWFANKRTAFAFAVPGNGINQALASGVSDERWNTIAAQANESMFGNVVNFPFADARQAWPTQQPDINTTAPISSSVRTLFITGSLDCRTPVEQVNEIMKGFSNSTHLIVTNAGHEQAMWDTEIFDEAIPKFLMGEDASHVKAFYKEIKFIPLKGKQEGHDSLR